MASDEDLEKKKEDAERQRRNAMRKRSYNYNNGADGRPRVD
jgi:hypothetical protein